MKKTYILALGITVIAYSVIALLYNLIAYPLTERDVNEIMQNDLTISSHNEEGLFCVIRKDGQNRNYMIIEKSILLNRYALSRERAYEHTAAMAAKGTHNLYAISIEENEIRFFNSENKRLTFSFYAFNFTISLTAFNVIARIMKRWDKQVR